MVLRGGREVPRDVPFVAAPPAARDAAIAHLSLERTGPDLLAGRHVRPHLRRRRVRRRDLVTVAPAVAQALATGQRAAVGVTRDLAAAHVAAG